MFALPGSAYLYQGEELGLPEVVDLPDSARQDPTFFRHNGTTYGRDGCRVPIPWESAAPAYGFSPSGKSWLPQPVEWGTLARDQQLGAEGSTLELYRSALALRTELGLGLGSLSWIEGYGADVIAFRTGDLTVVANLGTASVELPAGTVLVSSQPISGTSLPPDATAWISAS
jgi:alpha-glucosidase